MKRNTTSFDASIYLDDPESQAELLADALECGDQAYITHALGVVAKARGMSGIARDAGVTREALYKALSEDGDPGHTTLIAALRELCDRWAAKGGATSDQTHK